VDFQVIVAAVEQQLTRYADNLRASGALAKAEIP
jgi:hypothetical protein